MKPIKYKDTSGMINNNDVDYNSYPHPHSHLSLVERELEKKILLVVALKTELKKQKELSEDLMELVDMFATNNVDLDFYKRIRKEYFDSKLKD
jgi:predicted site-specific integrase-resolvase